MTRQRLQADDDRGVVLPLVALCLATLILAVSFSVDLGRLASRTRDLQKVADEVSVDTVRLLDGHTFAELNTIAQSAAIDSANRNDFPLGGSRQMLVELGTWDRDTTTFKPSAGDPTSRPNAVRVTATDTVNFLFNASGRTTSRTAIAKAQPTLDFSVGSIAAGLQPGVAVPPNVATILNQTLGQELSQNLNLSLVSYQGLAAASVGLQDLATALGLGSADDLLTTRVSMRSVLEATVTVLNSQGDQASLAAATTLDAIAGTSPPNKTVGPLVVQCSDVQGAQTCQSFSDPDKTVIVDNTPGHVADVHISVQQLLVGLNASGDVIDGHNFLSFDLDPSALGFPTGAIDSIHVRAAFIEPAQETSGPVGTMASTGQVRFAVDVKLHSTLDLLNGSSLPISVTLPFVFDLAHADATVTRIACYDPDPNVASQSDIAVATSAADFYIGDITNQSLKAQTPTDPPLTIPTSYVLPDDIVVVAGVATMTGIGHVSLGGGNDVLHFQGPYGPTNTQRANGGFDTSGVNSLTDRILSQVTLDHQGLPIAIPTVTPPNINPSVDPVIQQLLTKDGALVALDQLLFAPLTQALGVSFGGADVTALGIDCTTPILVK